MWESVLGSVVSAAATSILSQQQGGSSGSTSSNNGFNPYSAAMSQQAASSLMSPMRPKQKRDNTPAQTVNTHPLRAYTDQFSRM